METVPKRLPAEGLRKLLGRSRDYAEVLAEKVRQDSISRMNAAIDDEVARLEVLRTRNKMVSEREIQWWKDRRSALSEALNVARIRLDSFLIVLPKSLK